MVLHLESGRELGGIGESHLPSGVSPELLDILCGTQ